MDTVKVPKRWANFGLFGVFAVLAAVAYSFTSTFPSPLLPGYPGSAMFPRLVLIAMGVISVSGLLRTLFDRGGATDLDGVELPVVAFAWVVGVLLAFALLMYLFGTEVAIFCLIGGGIWVRTRKILLSTLAGSVSVIVVYLIFVQALSVHLPLLFLPRYLFLGI